MPRAPRSLLAPLIGFLLMSAAAVGVTAKVGEGDSAELYAVVCGYLAALRAGDAAQAARFRADGDAWAEWERARSLRGVAGFVARLQIEEDGREARVAVQWPERASGGQIWRREEAGPWRLVAQELLGPPHRR